MDQFLYWYSQNNKLIIQVLAVLIGITLMILMYRLFFVASSAQEDSDSTRSPQMQDIDKKISGVMSALENIKQSNSSASSETTEAEQAESTPTATASAPASSTASQPTDGAAPAAETVSQTPASAAAPATAPAPTAETKTESTPTSETPVADGTQAEAASQVSATQATPAEPAATTTTNSAPATEAAIASEPQVNVVEVENLKNDLSSTKSALKAREKELEDVKNQLAEQKKLLEKSSKNSARVMVDTSTLNGDKDLIEKIDELQKKLAEYDIIADDISELQTLRKENSELKEKVASTTATSA